MFSHERHKQVTADNLAELWCIGIKRAQATINAISQHYTRSALLPIAKRYRADRMYNVKRLNWKLATDTFFSDVKSLKQNICGQVYTHKCGFAKPYPMPRATGTSIDHTLRYLSMILELLLYLNSMEHQIRQETTRYSKRAFGITISNIIFHHHFEQMRTPLKV